MSLEWCWWIVRTRRVSTSRTKGCAHCRTHGRDQYAALIAEGKVNRPKNPEPDLVPETIFPPDKLSAQFQELHLWALRRVLPLVKTWGLNLQHDLSRLNKTRADNPHPLGNIPLVVLTAADLMWLSAGTTSFQVRQDHLRLQDDLASLSTDSKHVIVAGSGHGIYLYQPAAVVQSISSVVTAVRSHSRLSAIN